MRIGGVWILLLGRFIAADALISLILLLYDDFIAVSIADVMMFEPTRFECPNVWCWNIRHTAPYTSGGAYC